jgi:hypothetical protein
LANKELTKQKREAIQALLADGKLNAADIAFVAQEEEKKIVEAAEKASKPAMPTLSDKEWEDYKAFMLDHAGDTNWIPEYEASLRAIQQDNQAEHFAAKDRLWKRLRKTFFAQFEF